jgi:hypothetical protein
MGTSLTDPITLATSADQSAAQFLFLRLTGDKAVATCNALGQRAIGGQATKPAAAVGSPVGVTTPASKKGEIKLGATLAANAEVTSAADGRAVAAASGHVVNAILITGGVANDIVECVFVHGRLVP